MLSRREFLIGAAALPASVATLQIAAAADVAPLSFVIVSDTHLGRKDQPAPLRQWQQAIEEINRLPGEFVLHLGDIVDGGREAQYPIYVEARKSLTKPIHEIPGNHDPDELFQRHIRAEIDTSFDAGGVRFLLIGNAHPDSHLGFITARQLAWLEERSRDAELKELKLVLGCHVPVHQNGHPDRGWYVKPDDGQTKLYELVDRRRDQFLAFFHGHFHNGVRGWRDHGRVVEVCCPSALYNQDRGLKAAGAPGFTLDDYRPGYTLVTLGAGKLTLTYKPLGAEPGAEYTAEIV